MTDELDSYDGSEQDGPLWGQVSADEEEVMRKHHLANPDDRPGFMTHGERVRSLRGPDFTGPPATSPSYRARSIWSPSS